MLLPETFTLKSKYNNKYLRYTIEDKELYGFLKFSGDEPLTSYSIFHAEVAKTDDRLVNIRSFYNNKYCVSQKLENQADEYYFVARADEPNEDTLFEPSRVEDNPCAIRLRHVNLQKYVSLSKASPPFLSYCIAGSADPDLDTDRSDVLIVAPIDPQASPHVHFKGDNGKYLTVHEIGKLPYLKFSSIDADHPRLNTKFEIHLNHFNPTIRIKSISNGSFWRPSPRWVLADAQKSDSDICFELHICNPEKREIVLKVGNRYCHRYHGDREDNTEGKADCLIADDTNIIPREAKIQMEEATILSRTIFNIELNKSEASWFNDKQTPEEVASGTATNPSDEEMKFNLPYRDPVTVTWSSRISTKIFNRFKILAKFPLLDFHGNIEIRDEPEQDYTWGEPIAVEEPESPHYVATVPPKSKVKVRLSAVKGTVVVPFEYTQQDTLVDGKTVTLKFDDGVCSVTKILKLIPEIQCESLGE